MPPIRIGVLGAARIAPTAIIRPARAVAGAEVVSVAARLSQVVESWEVDRMLKTHDFQKF